MGKMGGGGRVEEEWREGGREETGLQRTQTDVDQT